MALCQISGEIYSHLFYVRNILLNTAVIFNYFKIYINLINVFNLKLNFFNIYIAFFNFSSTIKLKMRGGYYGK